MQWDSASAYSPARTVSLPVSSSPMGFSSSPESSAMCKMVSANVFFVLFLLLLLLSFGTGSQVSGSSVDKTGLELLARLPPPR